MSPDVVDDLQKQVNDAFELFKETLETALADEARRSVDAAVERLSGDLGNFRLDHVTVEVVIKNLQLSCKRHTGPEQAAPESSKDRASAMVQ
jgi:hypothetical protein